MTVHQLKTTEHSEIGNHLLDVPKHLIELPAWLNDQCLAAGYKEKSEYHVTVIARELAGTISRLSSIEDVDALVNAYHWSLEPTETYIEIAKDDENGVHRRAIIQLVRILEFERFFEELEQIIHEPVAVPPAHITLFTKNYDRGIGVYSEEDLQRYTIKRLTP